MYCGLYVKSADVENNLVITTSKCPLLLGTMDAALLD